MNKKYLLLIILVIGLLIMLENVNATCSGGCNTPCSDSSYCFVWTGSDCTGAPVLTWHAATTEGELAYCSCECTEDSTADSCTSIVNSVICAGVLVPKCCQWGDDLPPADEQSALNINSYDFDSSGYETFGATKPLAHFEAFAECVEWCPTPTCKLLNIYCGQYYYYDTDEDDYESSVIAGQYTDYSINWFWSTIKGNDCNDTNSAIHPGATEICNNIDDDCDGAIDEGGVCCQITDVSITPSCTGTMCGKGQTLTVAITYIKDCSAANLAQVDLFTNDNVGLGPSCKIQYNGINMQGINSSVSLGTLGGTTSITYIIPTIPDTCAGKTLTKTQAAFYQGTPLTGIVKSNYYTGDVSPITLNQCYDYTWVDYPSWAPLYKATKNIDNKYWATCYNTLIKKDAIVLNQWAKATTPPREKTANLQ